MARSSIDRRSRSLSVQELRRDLREADEQRYRLEAALSGAAAEWLRRYETAVPASSRSIRPLVQTAALCAVAAVFLACGLAWPRFQPSKAATVTASPNVSPMAAALPMPAPTPVLAPMPSRAAAIETPAVAVPFAPAARQQAFPRASKAKHQTQGHRRPPAHRIGPHPLSPAEFGRRADRAS
jgi:hypothetical protein